MRNVRFPLMLTEREDKEIQAYRFSRKIGTKAQAVRDLINKGLEAEKVATTGPEFGDTNPVDARNKTGLEANDAESI